jgi:hypothetical protein
VENLCGDILEHGGEGVRGITRTSLGVWGTLRSEGKASADLVSDATPLSVGWNLVQASSSEELRAIFEAAAAVKGNPDKLSPHDIGQAVGWAMYHPLRFRQSRSDGIGTALAVPGKDEAIGCNRASRPRPLNSTSYIYNGDFVRANSSSIKRFLDSPASGLSYKGGTSTHSPGHGNKTRL